MKKYNWILILLIIACVAGFFAYRTMDQLRTDTQPPQIKMGSEIPVVSVSDPKSALMQGITATDKVDGDVTDSLVVESITLLDQTGRVMVGYAAFDKAGNVAKTSREARYSDYRSPRFTMNGPLAYTYGLTFDILSTVGATDVIDGDIQHRVRAMNLEENSIALLGTHYVQFQVSNSLGDKVTQVFPVEVYHADTYTARLSLTDYLIYLPVGTPFYAEKYLNEFTLQGEDTDLSRGLPKDYELKTTGSVQTQYPGVYTLEYRVTYTDRHETNPEYDRRYTGYSKLIIVVEG